MSIGIIAEFNPLHKGHEYLINEAKKHGTVICVMSGNFVQRGDTAIADKRLRALAALNCGVDVVLELPVLWSMSTAQNFALGGVSALKYAGCEKIIFGSECGDMAKLSETANILESSHFTEKLAKELESGVTFASARQSAAVASGADAEILSGANNNLGLEYINASKKLNYEPCFISLKRIGANHDSMEESEFVSASLLRGKLKAGDYGFCRNYMPDNALNFFDKDSVSDISRVERAILGILRTKTYEEISKLPDLSEGVENKLFSALKLASSLEELYNTMKVKRYTLARIRRLVLSAFLGFDNSFFLTPLPYLRVLGFSKTGEQYLKEKLIHSPIPVITRVSDFKNLGNNAQKVFDTECRATDLFMLSLPVPKECGLEYKSKIIKT